MIAAFAVTFLLSAGAPPLATYDPAQMDAYVRALHASAPTFEARLERVIREVLPRLRD